LAYSIAPSEQFLKDVSKLKEKPLKKLIQQLVYHKIADNPYLGHEKKGSLAGYYTWNFEYPPKVRKNNRTDYRIGYRISEETKMIYVLIAGTHENFYAQFSRRAK
jgi:mRNA-degrading endonuclease RelE of RelBE toxin-antitoxin system